MAMPKNLKDTKDDIKETANEVKENLEEIVTNDTLDKKEEVLETETVEDTTEDVKKEIKDDKTKKEKSPVEEIQDKLSEAPVNKTTGTVVGIDPQDLNKANKYFDQERKLKGVIIGVDSAKEELSILCDEFKQVLKMKFDKLSNVSAKQFRPSQLYSLGEIKFYIDEIDEKNKDIYVSSQKIVERALRGLEGKEFDVEVYFFINYGAFVKVKDQTIFGIIKNSDFMPETFVRIEDAFKIGDTIPVKIASINEENRVVFSPTKNDFEIPRKFKDEDFVPGSIIVGVVKSIKPSGTFVNLDAGVDGLCSIPPYLEDEVSRNSKVCYRITKASKENGLLRIKGKIVNVIK